MKKNVPSLSIQAMFGGYCDSRSYWMHTPQRSVLGTTIKVRFRVPPNPEDTLDFRVFLSPFASGVGRVLQENRHVGNTC